MDGEANAYRRRSCVAASHGEHAAGRLPFAALLLTTALALIRTIDQPRAGLA